MWTKLSKGSSIALSFVLLFSAAIVLLPEEASAAVLTDDTDTDFSSPGAEFTNTEVVGTGSSASVELMKNFQNWVKRGPPPDPGLREGPAYCFDEVGGVMVIFGGYHAGYKNDTWEYDFPSNTWTEISTDPTPLGREWARMAYDSTNELCVLFGGWGSEGGLADTWEYHVSTNTWENTTPFFSPPAMTSVALTHDSGASKTILVGEDMFTAEMQTWAYDASMDAWMFRTAGSPSPSRVFHDIAYDASLGKTVLFGGAEPGMPPTLHSDTWEFEYSSDTWTFRGTGGPSGRYEHAMTYSSSENAIYLFGGRTDVAYFSDTWKRTGAAWSSLSPLATPDGRASPALAYDTSNGYLIVCCGYDNTQRFNDTWALGTFYTFQGFYKSRVFDTGFGNTDYGYLYFNQSEGMWPPDTEIRMQLATSDSPTGPWFCVGPDGTSLKWFNQSVNPIPDLHDNHTYIRYCVTLISYDNQDTPSLENVTITYEVPPAKPYLVATDPSHSQINVDPATCVRMDFSESMNKASVNVTLYYWAPKVLTGIVFDWTWTNSDKTLTLCPQTPFLESRGVQVWVNGTDLDGFALDPSPPGPGVANPFFFVTSGEPPYIVSTNPAHTQTGVPQDADVVITWSEPMDTSSVTWTINLGTDPGDLTESWNSPTDTILTLAHATPFVECDDFEFEVLTAKDKSGKDFEPLMGQPNPWSFKVVCFSPYVVQTDPQDGQWNVPVNYAITVWFSEAMSTPTLAHHITPTVSLTPSWPASDRLVVNHANFLEGTTYTYCIDDIEDLVGYHLLNAPYCISFSTFSDNPSIVLTFPAHGTTDADPLTDVRVVFSEEMNQASVTWTLSPNVPDKATWIQQWDMNGIELSLMHPQPMMYCGEYTFEVTAGKDLSGNDLIPGLVPNPWTFNTTFEYPCMMYTSPRHGETGVDLLRDIVIDFSEPIDYLGMPFEFTVAPELNGTVWTETWSNGSRTVTLSHSLELVPGSSIDVTILEAYDLDGNLLKTGPVPNPFTFFTSTAPGWPSIVWTSPAYGDMAVLTDALIVVQFDETMDTGSVTSKVDDLDGPSSILFTPSWSQTVYPDDTLTLDHVEPLRECQTYWVTIAGKDLDGNPLQIGLVPNPWLFYTICVYPLIMITDPADQEIQVPLNKSIVIDFSEEMQPNTLEWTIVPDPDPGNWIETWSNGNATVTLSHSNDFDQCTIHDIQVTKAWDLDNNDLDPGPVPNPWAFTTACINPYIVSTDPSHDETDVPQDYNVTVVFSEPMDTASVVFEIQPSLPFNTTWSGNDTVLTVTHTDLFLECKLYDTGISAGTDKDGYGLIPGPSPVPNPWSFTTVCINPWVVDTYPLADDVGIPLDAPIIIDFSEPMNPATVSIFVSPSPGGWGPHEWGNNNMTLWWNHSNNYTTCDVITVTIQSGQDTAGLDLLGPDLLPLPYDWSFMVECPNPFIVWTDPAANEIGVEITRDIQIEFSDPMDTGTVIWVISPDPNPGSWVDLWFATDTLLVLQHPNDFAPDTIYTLSVTAGKDKDGHDLIPGPVPNPWQFKTGIITGPRVNWTDPTNGQLNVGLMQDVVISFTKEVVPGTFHWNLTLGPDPGGWTESWGQMLYPNDTVTLSHSNPFQETTSFCIRVEHAKDVFGQDLETGPYDFCFSTTSILPPPGGLTVTRAGGLVHVSWNLVTGATHYNIYDSADKNAPFPSGWNTNQVPDPANSYDFPYLGDGLTHYFVVRAFDSGAGDESTNSTMGVKIHKAFAFNPAGTNIYWMSLPFISEYSTASDIANELTETNVNVIAKWDRDKQEVLSYYYARGKWRGKDFTLSAGDGIYVNAINNFDWYVVGTDSDATISLPLSASPVKKNKHWVSTPNTGDYLLASDIVWDIESGLGPGRNVNITEVGLWDPVSQTERIYYYTPSGWTGDDFLILPGDGIYIKIVQSFTWDPLLVTPYVS